MERLPGIAHRCGGARVVHPGWAAMQPKAKQWCSGTGHWDTATLSYTPQENGKIKRMWGTVTEMARRMLETAGLPKQLWPYALATSFYVKNRCFHSKRNSTPYEMFFGEMPNLSEMQLSGCRAFVLTENRKKRDSKAQTGTFWATRAAASVSLCAQKMELLSESRARCEHQGT